MREFNMYFDESGTHASSPVLIMGGLLGSTEQFTTFGQLLDRIRDHYSFDIFHAVDMKGGRKDFQAWPYEKQLALAVDFDQLITKTLTATGASCIDKNEYEMCYSDDPQFPDVPKDSAYGLCFRMCLIAFLEKIEEVHRYRHEPYVVNVTVEQGDPNWKDAKRIFEESKADASICFGVNPLGTFRTATKQECHELMLADFLAYTDYMIRTRNLDECTLSQEEIAALGLPLSQPNAERSKRIRISFDPEQLKKLTAHLADLHRRRHKAEQVT
jgi:Protein of unknown function (DUF3800)